MKRLACVLVLSLTACQTGVGGVSRDLVDLYDTMRPDGVIEIEIDRDGRIREMEAETRVEDLPASVLEVAEQRYPDARVIGAEREILSSGAAWEVQLEQDGRKIELVVDEAGNIRETEKELDRSEWPEHIVQAADAAFAEGTIRSVETIGQDDVGEYHVKKAVGDVTYKIVLTSQGEVVRVVREARAEIEIPLAPPSVR